MPADWDAFPSAGAIANGKHVTATFAKDGAGVDEIRMTRDAWRYLGAMRHRRLGGRDSGKGKGRVRRRRVPCRRRNRRARLQRPRSTSAKRLASHASYAYSILADGNFHCLDSASRAVARPRFIATRGRVIGNAIQIGGIPAFR